MKIRLLALASILLFFAGFITTQNTFAEDIKQKIVDVDDVMKSPGRYTGVITVAGAVSEVYQKDGFVILIDRKEYRQCGKETCALLKLPVKWSGPMPSVRDIIVVQGEIKETGGYVFSRRQNLKKIPVQTVKEL